MVNQQKTVLLGVTGCIAAYKACEIVRAFQKAGYRVKVVMTEHATHFIDPTTFRALTREPVGLGLFDDPSDPIHHISLAQEAVVFLIAPCTANVMAKITYGIADDLLTTTALATTAPLVIAPAMNVHMYENAATQHNMAILKQRGVTFSEADDGYLACGDVGKGRLPEPETIARFVMDLLEGQVSGAAEQSPQQNAQQGAQQNSQQTAPQSGVQDLVGKRVVVTAGPTVEPIDPVRYLTNRSSGKFGYAIAQAAADRGASVTLISGPVALQPPAGVEVVHVESARDMLAAAERVFAKCDAAFFAAAVADIRPLNEADQKLKKGINDDLLSHIELTENPDILSTLGHKKTHQVVVGFAAETHDVLTYAQAKLQKKNADMIVANAVGAHKTFGSDTDEVGLVTADGVEHYEEMLKADLAQTILDKAFAIN